MYNKIQLANIIKVRYVGLVASGDIHLLALIYNIIDQIKDECKDKEEIINKTIKILDKVL